MRAVQCLSVLEVLTTTGACPLIGSADLHDLKIVSAEFVDLKDRPDAVWLGVGLRPSRPLAMVTFTTKTNLIEFARRYDYNIVEGASFCSGNGVDEAKKLQEDSSVYDLDGRIDMTRRDSRASPGVYHIYLDVTPMKFAGHPSPFAYDLRHQPEDVCIEVRGGNMLGRTFVSNVMIVSKDLLSAVASRGTGK
jgi:hypothetical protein